MKYAILLLAVTCLPQVASAQTGWWRTYGGTDYDEGYSVQQSTDGGYVIVGWAGSFGAGGSDVYLIKTNAEGDTFWTRTYGGTSDERATPSNRPLMAGTSLPALHSPLAQGNMTSISSRPTPPVIRLGPRPTADLARTTALRSGRLEIAAT